MRNPPISARFKGLLFEAIINKILQENEYESFEVDNVQVDGQGRVRGRGEWHQIDALGRLKYTIPFIYPIRLLCEAKILFSSFFKIETWICNNKH